MLTPELVRQLGLDENEAKIYLALLELGPASVTEITKAAGITRTLGYVVLEKLGIDGLVTRATGRGKKIRYSAEHPRAVIQFVKNKKNAWERRIEKAEGLLPDLLSLYKVDNKPIIRYQEGTEGLKTLFEESLESTTEILAVTDVESWQDKDLWDWAKGYNRQRNHRKVKERILLLDTPQGRAWVKNYRPSPYTVYRWVTREQAKGLLEFGGELNVYENKVVIALPKKPHRLIAVVEGPVLANILRSMFEIVWGVARPVSSKK
jgi:sugar-specific transcriptional regulator TrmB